MPACKSRLPTHPLPVGAECNIFRIALFQRPFIEGRAVIVAPLGGVDDFYAVRFRGERRVRQRLVYPGASQTDPEGLLRRLKGEWQAALTPELLAEFFPGDL